MSEKRDSVSAEIAAPTVDAAAGSADYQDCCAEARVTGVKLTCQRVRDHKGPHSSTSYGVRWKDTGEVLPPPTPPRSRQQHCTTANCTLWLGHAGAHGEQLVIP